MIIRTNGEFKLTNNIKGRGASQTILYLSGTPDGATIQLHYKDELNQLVALTDGVLESPQQYVIYDGSLKELYVVVTNATENTEIAIQSEGAG